jgi:hypothetical protein
VSKENLTPATKRVEREESEQMGESAGRALFASALAKNDPPALS